MKALVKIQLHIWEFPFLFLKVLTRLLLGRNYRDDLAFRGVLNPRHHLWFFPPWRVAVQWLNMKAYVRDKGDYASLQPEYEPDVTTLFKPKRGNTVIDVGAHIGRYTLLGSKLVGEEGKVLALEPEAKNFRLLSTNIRLNRLKNVITLPIAAGSENGQATLYLSRSSGGHSVATQSGSLSGVSVEVRTLDFLLPNEKVDWIKIDVEGNEARVLQGAFGILRKHHPKLIVECFNDPSTNEVRRILEPLGYKVQLTNRPNIFPPYIFAE